MTDPISTPDTAITPAVVAAQAPVAPETFSREYVEELRSENAGHRVANRTAVEAAKAKADTEWQAKLDEATTAHTVTTDELSKSQLTLLKLTKVLQADDPEHPAIAIAGLVTGEDEESVSESVKTVRSILDRKPAKASAVDPSQGSGQGDIPLNGDPILDKLKAVVGIR